MLCGINPYLGTTVPSFRKIFPSYDWDEDVWRVNQIVYLSEIVGKENIGFVKNVPNEEVKRSDSLIRKWIDDNMHGCSCLILFVGEETYKSKWVKYEIQQACDKGMGRIIIDLIGMKNKYGTKCNGGPDPYEVHGLYSSVHSSSNYIIKKYSWTKNNGIENIKSWIEDACQRAGK